MLVYTKKEMGTETASIVVVSLQFNKTVLMSATCLFQLPHLGSLTSTDSLASW